MTDAEFMLEYVARVRAELVYVHIPRESELDALEALAKHGDPGVGSGRTIKECPLCDALRKFRERMEGYPNSLRTNDSLRA